VRSIEFKPQKEKKPEEDTRRLFPCSWTGRIKIVKLATLLKAIYRFSAITFKYPITFFTETEKSILNFIWEHS
jgi:hypothetical protein